MNFDLDPPRGVGTVQLGMSLEEAEQALRDWGEPKPFRRSSASPSGWKVQRGIMVVFVYCDGGRMVDAVEFSTTGYGITGTDQVIFRDVDLFATPVKDALDTISNMGLAIVEEESGSSFTVPDLVLSLWRDGGPAEEGGQPKYFESALIAQPGYYD